MLSACSALLSSGPGERSPLRLWTELLRGPALCHGRWDVTPGRPSLLRSVPPFENKEDTVSLFYFEHLMNPH